MNFAIVLGPERTQTYRLIPGVEQQATTRLANATVITSGTSSPSGSTNDDEFAMGYAIEEAVFAKAPDVPHAG